jgi:hypothetical protein
MKSATIRFTRCLAEAAIVLAYAQPAKASLVFSFALDADQTGVNQNTASPFNVTGTGRYSPTGGNSVVVPGDGLSHTYYIDVVVSTTMRALPGSVSRPDITAHSASCWTESIRSVARSWRVRSRTRAGQA